MRAAAALFSLVSVWILLALGGLAERNGLPHAVPFSFVIAIAWVAATRPPGTIRTRANRDPGVLMMGWLGGAGASAALTLGVLAIGLALGMPSPHASYPAPGDAFAAMGLLVLAPTFEELLYRERIPDALTSLPRPARAVIASALFALPHLEPWRILGTFVVGILLAVTREISGSIALCIAIHAGLNFGALVGITPAGASVPALFGSLAWLLASHRARALTSSIRENHVSGYA